jgi:hypothetical protein
MNVNAKRDGVDVVERETDDVMPLVQSLEPSSFDAVESGEMTHKETFIGRGGVVERGEGKGRGELPYLRTEFEKPADRKSVFQEEVKSEEDLDWRKFLLRLMAEIGVVGLIFWIVTRRGRMEYERLRGRD